MFKKSARYYDALYSSKAYREEAAKLHALIEEQDPGAKTLLDVACGTGHHLQHLIADYSAEGVDISPEMLDVARRRLPNLTFHEGDMATFDLGKQFDAVVCLFSSIGYMQTLDRLRRAIANMARHVNPGGVLIVEPWFKPEDWTVGYLHSFFVDEPGLRIARMTESDRRSNVAIMDMHHLVGTKDGVEYFVEHHEMALFTHDEYLDAFSAIPLEVAHDPSGFIGRGLYIGLRPR